MHDCDCALAAVMTTLFLIRLSAGLKCYRTNTALKHMDIIVLHFTGVRNSGSDVCTRSCYHLL